MLFHVLIWQLLPAALVLLLLLGGLLYECIAVGLEIG